MSGSQPLSARSRWFVAERVGETTVLRFTQADLGDEQAAHLIGSQLSGLAEGQDRPRLVLDFGLVRRVSSATLGKLIALSMRVRRAGGELTACSLSPELYEQFERTRLNKLFRICREG